MTTSVLFDAPGPKTVARHRAYTVVSVVALAALVAFAVWKLYDRGQLEYALWEPYVTPKYVQYVLVDGLVPLGTAYQTQPRPGFYTGWAPAGAPSMRCTTSTASLMRGRLSKLLKARKLDCSGVSSRAARCMR